MEQITFKDFMNLIAGLMYLGGSTPDIFVRNLSMGIMVSTSNIPQSIQTFLFG